MFRFAQHGQVGHVGQRAAAAHREDRRRHHRHQDDEHGRDQSRSGDHVHPDRIPAARPSEHGRVAQLRPGQREPESAGVRRAAVAGATRSTPISRCSRGCGAAASCRRAIRACGSAPAATPVLYLEDPPGIEQDDAARRCSMRSAKLNAMKHEAYGDPEIETRIAQYEMAYRMQTSVPELMDLSKEPESRVRDVRPGVAQARHLRRQLPAGAAAGRARRALHPALSSRLGSAQRSAARSARCSARAPISRPRRWSPI